MKEQDKNLQPIKMRYGIVGNSVGLNRALDTAIQVAPTNLSVLIQGESGVGKEVLPRIIHDNSSRKHQKYLAINCGSIPEGTIDAELFGHEKGAYTGAVGEREGYFGAANKGTLFLDEVGELPLATQARLLRVLETGEYIRVGASDIRKTDVRIVAATNVNLQKAVNEGKFREDLYFRLATIPIKMPPLRDRGQDIELLFIKFARELGEQYKIKPLTLTDEGRELLLNYKWPGNIRELKNVVGQITILSENRQVDAETLKEFGITNDNIAGTGMVLVNAAHQTDYTHSYENEREMLFRILASLGKEVREIKSMINNLQNNGGMNSQTIQYVDQQAEEILSEEISTSEISSRSSIRKGKKKQ